MSLSRFFKSSRAFQPEEIIKSTSSNDHKWQEENRQPEKPFQSQKIEQQPEPGTKTKEDTLPVQEIKSDDTTHNEDVTDGPAPGQTVTDETEDGADEKVSQPEKFLLLEEAEKRIEAAYNRGLLEGQNKADIDFGSAARALLNSCRQLETLRETLITNSGFELQEFSLAIAERIIRSSLREQDDTIVATIEEALQLAVKSDEFHLYVNPDDYDIIAAKSAEIIAEISGLNNIIIKKDPTIEKGGAKIESDNCTIDATIANQFDVIRNAIQQND